MRPTQRAALHVLFISGLILSLAASVSTAPAPTPVLRVDFLSFAASLPPPVDRLEIRQAVAHGIDRQALANSMSGAIPAVGINHPKLPGYNPQVRGYSYDPAKAKALIAQAGWDPESLLRIYLSTSYTGSGWERVRGQILENLAAVGIKAQFVTMAFDALTRLITTGGGAVYIIGWRSDRTDFGYPYFSLGIAADWKFKDGAEVLIQRYQQTTEAATKEKIAQELEQLLLDRTLIIPLFFRG